VNNKEALQSQTEYKNDNLLEKLLLDRGIEAEGTYTAANEKDELREGSFSVKYNGAQLIAMAKTILKKYDMDEATVTGEAIW